MDLSLGKDLEVIDDGAYVKLRRRSSLLIPTFCFYSLLARDASQKAKSTGKQKVSFEFDERIYDSFSQFDIVNVVTNENVFSTLIFQCGPFFAQFVFAIYKNKLKYNSKPINYTEFEKDEFFIEPTDRYEELFYKNPRYSYQHESRICLLNVPLNNIYERYTLDIGKLNDDDFKIIEKIKMRMEMTVDVIKL